MKKQPNAPVDWNKVEHLCLMSFTGQRLSDEGQDYLKAAYASDPDEYGRRTRAVRDSERSRLKSF